MTAPRQMRWLAVLLTAVLAPSLAQAAPECGPAALQGDDWRQAVQDRTALCGDGTLDRAMTAVALYDARVQFEFDSATLSPVAQGTLVRLASFLRQSGRMVLIEAHTDSAGSDKYNLALSERRAASVHFVLLANGVRLDRMRSRGLGRSKPLPSVDPADGVNRRVEFIIGAQGEPTP